MKFKIIEYKPPPNDFHVVENLEDECIENIDLMIGPRTRERGIKEEDLVGKIIEVNDRHVYCWMANDLRIVE